jgi:lysozyme
MHQQTNEAGIDLIKFYEGLRTTAYKDPSGVWTIGYGHTGGVYKGETITIDEADYLLAQDLAQFEDWVALRTDNPTSNQFSAMVSLCFNIGKGAFLSSSVRRYHNLHNFAAAAQSFLLWDKITVDGQLVVSPGLDIRRESERQMYLS